MPQQTSIKQYFHTDKDIAPPSTRAAPAEVETPTIPPDIPPAPSIPANSSVPRTSSVHGTPPTSVTPTTAVSTSLKRRGSQALQSGSSQKRLRIRTAARDSGTSTAVAGPEDDFPDGPVTVWAMTRGDLCSSQQTFRQYQSGTQTKKNVVTGVYINTFTEPRDFLGRNKLITCNGGGREKDGKGNYIRTDVQPSVVARWKAALHTPIVVIMGKGHPAYEGLNLPNVVRDRGAFVELGTFMVTKIWSEKMPQPDTDQSDQKKSHYKVWKIMLQTLDPTSKPWYWKETVPSVLATEDAQQPGQKGAPTNDGTQTTAAPLVEATCISCRSTSPKIFDNAPWVCLKDDCNTFFMVGSSSLAIIGDDGKDLQYSRAFIDHITPYQEIQNPPTMFEPLPKALVAGGAKFGTEAAFRNGLTCPDCRCANSRRFWDKLVCRNCGFEHSAPPLPYPLALVEKETQAHTKSIHVKDDGVTITLREDHVDLFVENDKDGLSTRFVYMIKDNNGDLIGTFVVERPSDLAKKAPGGADEIYTSIEADGGSMRLKRNPARCPGSVNELLTAHFQSNFGALYEFGPKGIDTEPFENAPDVVLKSLVYLKHFGEKALHSSQSIASRENYTYVAGSTLQKPQKPFNELLALGYRESDHISWHDDGEGPLTGVISTGSFGSPGKMALRFKEEKEDNKKATNKATNKATKKATKKVIKKVTKRVAKKATKKAAKKAKEEDTEEGNNTQVILEVQLRHGDVATMCDTRLQALTDHAVDPKGIRRYAMTSRTINFDYYRQPKEEEKLAQKGLTVDEMEKAAQIPGRALQFAYNGTTLGDQEE